MADPVVVRQNASVADLIGLSADSFAKQPFLDVFSGNQILANTRPIAQAYAGHQFGTFNPFLGDGRSVLLGEVDWRGSSWDLVLKGSGKTPFTFVSDGWSTSAECLHEYELTERLALLGVPTIRCLSVIEGSERAHSSGGGSRAIVATLSPSRVRFGSFENCYFRRDVDALRILADYVIEHHFPECQTSGQPNDYARFFKAVVTRTATLIAKWQNVGFVHGMMNTDNQSIVGITLDLGESRILEEPNEDFVAARSDRHGRYAFGQQPIIGLWNCNVLARALSPLVSSQDLRDALSAYEPAFFEQLTA